MTVTVAFYRGRYSGRIGSRLLAWWQRCDWSHCFIVWEMDGEKALVSEAVLHGGVRTRWRYFSPWMHDCWTLDVDADAVRAWWTEHEGEAYDWLGLAGFIFRRIKGASKAAWCSEAVASSLGLLDPWRYDVAEVANHCRMFGIALPRAQAQQD